MPGTIQVSVMEFKGLLPSTVLKLSLGKREYQTSDTGDFSFPLTNLREDLVVRLLDAEGNEIALKGIQTMSIVEKVSWDETFPLDGGGHVHLKLQFVLNQEERNRIRLKREEALKRKQGSIPNISHEMPEVATTFGSSVSLPPHAKQKVSENFVDDTTAMPSEESQTRTVIRVASVDNVTMLADPLPNIDVSPAGLQSTYGMEEGDLLQQDNPKAVDKGEGTFTTSKIHGTEAHQIASEEKLHTQPSVPKVEVKLFFGKEKSSGTVSTASVFPRKRSSASLSPGDDHVDKSHQGQLNKTPSNVRKLVSAFESSLPKDVKSAVKPPTIRSEPKKVAKGGHSMDCDPEDVIEPTETSSERKNNPFVAADMRPGRVTSHERVEHIGSGNISLTDKQSKAMNRLEQASVTAVRPIEKERRTHEWTETLVQLERSSSTEKPSTSVRMDTDHAERADSFRLSTEENYFPATSYAGGRERTDSTKFDILGASVKKSKSLEHYEEENFFSENSGMWIFPNDTKRLCITTAGKEVRNLLENDPTEAKERQKKNSSSSSSSGDAKKDGSDREIKKREKESQSPRKNSSNDGPGSGGLAGQVLKIAIIVGFGVFVFFTRQREPRKSKRDTTDEHFFTTSEYVDGQTTIAEQED